MYRNPETFRYYSLRYHKFITVQKGFRSDGATGALDVCPEAWFVHDKLCVTGYFDDGTLCDNWQASRILSDILKDNGHWGRTYTWLWATWLFGGGACRTNGMFNV